MPRRTEEILEHADELARRFEDYEPQPGDAVEITALRLVGGAVARRAEAERELVRTVRQAREAGQSWPPSERSLAPQAKVPGSATASASPEPASANRRPARSNGHGPDRADAIMQIMTSWPRLGFPAVSG